MKATEKSGIDPEAAQRFAEQNDRIENSPAQPMGTDRIDDDAHRAPKHAKTPANVKPDDGHRMTH